MNTPHRNRQLRVAVVFEYPSLNGGEFSWLATLPALRANGIEPIAIAPDRGPLADRLRAENVAIENWQIREGGKKVSPPLLHKRLAEVLDRCRPDLVHANSLSMSRTIGPTTAQQGIPSIGHIRDIVRLSRKAVADLNQTSRLLAVSHATRDWHIAGGIDPRRIYVQYNGVDLDQFNPSKEHDGPVRRGPQLPDSAQLIGSIGQLGIRKGTEKLLESAQLIANDFPDTHWIIAGERHSEKAEAVEFEANLHRLASTDALKGRVHFIGRIQNNHVAAWMRTLTVLVHTARQEPLGRVLLEAAAAGLPIVATDAGGTREILGRHGQIVPVDDATAIAKSIRQTLSDHDDFSAKGRHLRSRAELAFPAHKRGKQLIEHYQAVVAEVVTRQRG